MSSVSFGGTVSDNEDPARVEKVVKSLANASSVELGNSSFRKLVLFSSDADIFLTGFAQLEVGILKICDFSFFFVWDNPTWTRRERLGLCAGHLPRTTADICSEV
jgi:hypothetical protein